MHAKKIKFLLVFFIAFVSGVTFTACSSDDDEEEVIVDSQSLVGYWINYSNHDQELIELGFKTDGTCHYTYSYEPDNDKLESEYEYATGTYRTKGSKLAMTLQFGDETEIWEFTIVSVSSSKLVLKDEYGEKITFESLYE